MITWTIPNATKSSEFFYFRLKFESADLDEDDLDLITWKLVILKALNNYYGLIGESMHFDLLQRPEKSSIIFRCQVHDKDTFSNAILIASGKTNGHSYSLTTLKKSAYLNGVI